MRCCRYISSADPKGYQPTNAAFGLLPPAPAGVRKKADREAGRSERALEALDALAGGSRVMSRSRSIKNWISRYLDYLTDQKHASPETVRAYALGPGGVPGLP